MKENSCCWDRRGLVLPFLRRLYAFPTALPLFFVLNGVFFLEFQLFFVAVDASGALVVRGALHLVSTCCSLGGFCLFFLVIGSIASVPVSPRASTDRPGASCWTVSRGDPKNHCMKWRLFPTAISTVVATSVFFTWASFTYGRREYCTLIGGIARFFKHSACYLHVIIDDTSLSMALAFFSVLQ